jgi:hypothetical protein
MANPAGLGVGVTAADGDTATATSPSFTPSAGGYWCFAAYYSGDSNYGASSDATTDGCFDVPPMITSASTTTFTEGAPATPFQVTSVGGYSPITYSETGTLPSGVTLSSAGVLSGTPGWSPETFPFTITATDASGKTASQGFVLTVATSQVLHIATTSPLPTGQVRRKYSFTLTATGGAIPYRWSIISSDLPRGLTLDHKTGTISGKPILHSQGSYSFEVQVKHASETATANFSLSVS